MITSTTDNGQYSALEGRNLRSMLPAAAALESGEFRNVRVEVKDGNRPGTLVMSGRAQADGNFSGTVRFPASGPDAGMTNRAARSLLEKLEAAHAQEAAQRRETELILDGLRILTSSRASREVFDALLALLAPALEFQHAVILQRDWSGQISAAVATDPGLAALDWQGTGTALFATDDIAHVYRIPEELALPAMPSALHAAFASGLAIGLHGGSKPTILLCLHGRSNFFAARHLGLGTRLSLVAGQAFMNEEERHKVVDASKLATIGELAAGIVHEINQPLTVMTLGVNNMLEMIELGGVDPAKLKTKLERLQGQIDRVTKIVANMRVLSRRSDGIAEPFSLDEAITEAAGIAQHKLSAAQIAVELPGVTGLSAHGNRLEFSQVILNLLTNAHDAIQSRRKKTGDASGAMAITVRAAALDADWLEISVRDTGCGFPNKNAERAFEPFFTTKDVGKGTGLGLALCRRIVENMGGSIGLGNWENGAEIRIRLKRIANTEGGSRE
jgi:signal transduction histidine kinase